MSRAQFPLQKNNNNTNKTTKQTSGGCWGKKGLPLEQGTVGTTGEDQIVVDFGHFETHQFHQGVLGSPPPPLCRTQR